MITITLTKTSTNNIITINADFIHAVEKVDEDDFSNESTNIYLGSHIINVEESYVDIIERLDNL